jgi:hypothetical protein
MRPSSKEGHRPRRVGYHLGLGDGRGGEVRCDRDTNQDEGLLCMSSLVQRPSGRTCDNVKAPGQRHLILSLAPRVSSQPLGPGRKNMQPLNMQGSTDDDGMSYGTGT